MADCYSYKPQSKVDWASSQAYVQFRMWRKEVERIINGPLHAKEDTVKLNTVFIWAGAHAETLVEARQAEDPELEIKTVTQLLDCLGCCLTHSTFFREAREDFYNAKQVPGENTTTYYSRIMELFRLGDFPAQSEFLVVDKLIHGCTNIGCKRKLIVKGKTVSVKECLDLLRRHEAVDVTMKRLGETCDVSAAYSRDPSKYSQKRGSKTQGQSRSHDHAKQSQQDARKDKPCRWCGGDQHARSVCPANDAQCTFCKKKGTF